MLNECMYHLCENYQDQQIYVMLLLTTFPRPCSGLQKGPGKTGTSLTARTSNSTHACLETSCTFSMCKLLQFLNQERFYCLQKRGVIAHFPHGFWLHAPHSLLIEWVCMCVCVCVSVCLYLERVSVKSKGPYRTCCSSEQPAPSGEPHPVLMHCKL